MRLAQETNNNCERQHRMGTILQREGGRERERERETRRRCARLETTTERTAAAAAARGCPTRLLQFFDCYDIEILQMKMGLYQTKNAHHPILAKMKQIILLRHHIFLIFIYAVQNQDERRRQVVAFLQGHPQRDQCRRQGGQSSRWQAPSQEDHRRQPSEAYSGMQSGKGFAQWSRGHKFDNRRWLNFWKIRKISPIHLPPPATTQCPRNGKKSYSPRASSSTSHDYSRVRKDDARCVDTLFGNRAQRNSSSSYNSNSSREWSSPSHAKSPGNVDRRINRYAARCISARIYYHYHYFYVLLLPLSRLLSFDARPALRSSIIRLYRRMHTRSPTTTTNTFSFAYTHTQWYT
ncbi:unnamed protein product [Trichogramma brassicae]|uniref:Uncharacterized protein n=1 Tax=Trichogramma brassicae TaxID=86971 RepID=A0A6H5IIF9_9HYME|nr:unnamed protein product [Trichogramma brassicae]